MLSISLRLGKQEARGTQNSLEVSRDMITVVLWAVRVHLQATGRQTADD